VNIDIITLGEVYIEWIKREKNKPHYVPGEYLGPYPSGPPLILSLAASKLGKKSGLISHISLDQFGQMIFEILNSENIDLSCLKRDDDKTGIAFLMYYENGQYDYIFYFNNCSTKKISEKDIRGSYIAASKILHINSSTLTLNESAIKGISEAFRIAEENDVIISIDINTSLTYSGDIDFSLLKDLLSKANLIFLDKEDLTSLTQERDLLRAGKSLLTERTDLVVTRIKNKGTVLFLKGATFFLPTVKNNLYTISSRYTFEAAFLAAYLEDWPLLKVTMFADIAQTLKDRSINPIETPSLNEVMKKLNEQPIIKELEED